MVDSSKLLVIIETMSIKTTLLKRSARKHYLAYMKAKDNLSCGATLAAHVSSTVYGHAKAFNDTMDELKQLDPSCPDARLPV